MKKRENKNYYYKKKQFKPQAQKPTIKSGTILCDGDIQPSKVLLKIMCYLPSDNEFAKLLYENPGLESLQVDELKLSSEEFIRLLHAIDVKLLFVRSLDFTSFWCATLDKNLREFMDTFLLNFDPIILRQLTWDKENNVIESMNVSYRSILKSILMIYLRISRRTETTKDTSTTYEISPECYSQLVYDEFLIDTAKLVDLCSIYAKSNSDTLKSIIFDIFELEPRYYDDLLGSIATISKEVNKLLNEVGQVVENVSNGDDAIRRRLLIRLYDAVNQAGNITRYFPPEGVDELFKVKVYLWLPIIRELTKSLALQLKEKNQETIRLINELMKNTTSVGIDLVNRGIIMRSFKSDF